MKNQASFLLLSRNFESCYISKRKFLRSLIDIKPFRSYKRKCLVLDEREREEREREREREREDIHKIIIKT